MLAALLALSLLASADAAPTAPPAAPSAPAPIATIAPAPPPGDGPACGSTPRAAILLPAIRSREAKLKMLDDMRRKLRALESLREDRTLRMPRDGQSRPDAPAAPEDGDDMVLADPAAHREETFHIDTTWTVPKGMTLKLSNFSGDILVEGWGRDAVRLVADRDRRDRVVISQSPQLLDLSSVSPMGFAEVDYKLSVPEWMPVIVAGVESNVTVKGIQALVRATSIRGDVRCTGGAGDRRLSSVEGTVQVIDSKGDVTAGSIDSDVLLERIDGLVQVESVNGDVRLDRIASSDVDASSMAGSVIFTGPFQKKGRYRLSSHSGDVTVGVPDGADLDVSVATFNGEFESGIPTPPRAPHTRGRRFGFTLGSGGSSLELESYQGLIQLLRPTEMKLRRVPRAPTPPIAPAPPARKEGR